MTKMVLAVAALICLAAPFFIPHGGLVTIAALLLAAIWSSWGTITKFHRDHTTKETLPPKREGQ